MLNWIAVVLLLAGVSAIFGWNALAGVLVETGGLLSLVFLVLFAAGAIYAVISRGKSTLHSL